jgi:hypothetical protein
MLISCTGASKGKEAEQRRGKRRREERRIRLGNVSRFRGKIEHGIFLRI